MTPDGKPILWKSTSGAMKVIDTMATPYIANCINKLNQRMAKMPEPTETILNLMEALEKELSEREEVDE